MGLVLQSSSCASFNHSRRVVGIIVHRPDIRKLTIISLEVLPTALESTEHVLAGDVVAALSDTSGDTTQCQIRRRQSQIGDFDAVPSGFPTLEASKVNQSAQCCFEREVVPLSCEAVQLRQEQPTCRYRAQFRPQRGQTACDEVGVHEMDDACFSRKELARERGLSGAVWAGNDDAAGLATRTEFQGSSQTEGSQKGAEKAKNC